MTEKMSQNNLPPEADAELETAEKSARKFDGSGLGTYVHKFRTPFSYQGTSYEELSFDFGKLTGKDFISIGQEMQMLRIQMSNPSVNMDFQMRLAARSCSEKLGPDAWQLMPGFDFHCITGMARNFLLSADLHAMESLASRAGSKSKA